MDFVFATFSYIFAGIVITLIIFFKFKSRPNHVNYPPGPSLALPLVGHLHLLGTKPHLAFQKWRKIYGPLFSLKLGGHNAVVLSDAKLVRQVFSNAAANGRMRNVVMDVFAEGKYGLITQADENWADQRRFSVRTLNTLGLARGGVLEGIIADEAMRLVKFFGKRVGVPILGNRVFNGAAVSSVWTMITGERNNWDVPDSEFPDSLRKMDTFMTAINKTLETGLMFFPWLRFLAPELSGWREFVENCKIVNELASDIIDKHEKARGVSNDFIEHYLNQIASTTDSSSGFWGETGRNNLRVTLVDLLMAGSETVATTMEYAILYVAMYKHVQKELQSELDRELGSGFPKLSDRPRLPYTEAFILETLRRSSVIGMGVPHRALEDIQLGKYTISQNTVIIADQYNIHHNAESWGSDSYEFRPERFLNEGKTRVVYRQDLMPFSTGRRICIGESLANDSLFLFVTSLMQHFDVELIDDKFDLSDMKPGVALRPKDFQIIVNVRNK